MTKQKTIKTMTKFNELFKIENGVFNIFATEFATEFASLFADFTATELNIYAAFRHGSKILIDGINDETKTAVITSVIKVRINQWLATAEAINADYQFANVITRTKRGSVSRETQNTDTATNYEKVYNDNEQTDTEKRVAAKDGEQTDTYDVTETETKQTQVETVEKIIKLRRNNLVIEIIDTLINEITINIYS